MSPAIPGFHWDVSKGKYFKILPGHQAPVGSKYTAEAIKKQREEAEQKQKLEICEQRLAGWGRIKRPRLSHENDYRLNASLRDDGMLSPDVLWAEGLSADSIVTTNMHWCDCNSFDQPGTYCTNRITCLKWNPSSKELMIAANGPAMYSDGKPLFKRFEDITDGRNDHKYAKTIDSLPAYVNGNGAESISIQGGGNIWMVGGRLIQVFAQGACIAEDDTIYSEVLPSVIKSLSSRPGSEDGMLIHGPGALGLMQGLGNPLSNVHHTSVESHVKDSEILTADWLDRNIVVWGRRDGRINLFDVRSKVKIGHLKHPSSASKLHPINGSQLLVVGLEEQMQMYDLRYGAMQKKDEVPVYGRHRICSRSLVVYPAYHNRVRFDLASAFSTRLNLVACGTPEGTVQLFNLREGSEVQPPPKVVQSSLEPRTLVRAMCFLDEVVDTGAKSRGPSLFMGRRHTIDEWTWR